MFGFVCLSCFVNVLRRAFIFCFRSRCGFRSANSIMLTCFVRLFWYVYRIMSKESPFGRTCFKEDAMFLVWMFRVWFVSDVVCWFSFACVVYGGNSICSRYFAISAGIGFVLSGSSSK